MSCGGLACKGDKVGLTSILFCQCLFDNRLLHLWLVVLVLGELDEGSTS